MVFVEADDLAQVLDDGSDGDDEVGEGIAADGALFGVGDVFVLASFQVSVDEFDAVAHAVGDTLFVSTPGGVLFVFQSASVGVFGGLSFRAFHGDGHPLMGAGAWFPLGVVGRSDGDQVSAGPVAFHVYFGSESGLRTLSDLLSVESSA